MNAELTTREVGWGQVSLSTFLVAIVGVGCFVAFPLGVARTTTAWPVPVAFFCWSLALLVPGAIIARVWRMRPGEAVAQLSLVALLWNLAVWPRVAAYRVAVLLLVPVAMLLAALVLRRLHKHDDPRRERGEFWRKVLGASAWNSLLSLALFLAIAYVLNVSGYVVSR